MDQNFDIEASKLLDLQRDPARHRVIRREVVHAMIDREERVKPAHICAIGLLFAGAFLVPNPVWVFTAIGLRLLSLFFTRWATRRIMNRIEDCAPIAKSLNLLHAALALAGATWAGLMLSVPERASMAATLAIDSVAVLGASLVIITYGPLRSAMMSFAVSFLATAGIGGVLILQVFPPITFAILTLLILGAVLFSRGIAEHNLIAAHLSVENRELSEKLSRALQRAEDLVWRDPMTNLYNRRAFFEKFQDPPDMGATRVFLTIDIDHFKAINDTYGHAVGDSVIKAVAEQMLTLQESLPFTSKHCSIRFGGEEFVMVLDRHDLGEAAEAAERLRGMIRRIPERFSIPEKVRVSASIGVAEQQPNENLDDVLRRSDLAMYRAKDRGRNRVALAA